MVDFDFLVPKQSAVNVPSTLLVSYFVPTLSSQPKSNVPNVNYNLLATVASRKTIASTSLKNSSKTSVRPALAANTSTKTAHPSRASYVTTTKSSKNVTGSLKPTTKLQLYHVSSLGTRSQFKQTGQTGRPKIVYPPGAVLREPVQLATTATHSLPAKLSNLIFSTILPGGNLIDLPESNIIVPAADTIIEPVSVVNVISVTLPSSSVQISTPITLSTRGQTINSPTAVSVTKPTLTTMVHDPFLLSSYAVTLKSTKSVQSFTKTYINADFGTYLTR